MLFKTIIVFIVVVGISVLLLNIKMFFRKNGKLEKSCTAKHRVLSKTEMEECATCGNPMECSTDKNEHDQFIPVNPLNS